MSAVIHKIKHEFMKVLPPTIFFFVILHIVALIRALMIKGSGVDLPVSASVLIASLVLGKCVLIADMLPFINRFPDKPLIWNVTWKTLMYALVALIVHYPEHLSLTDPQARWTAAPGGPAFYAYSAHRSDSAVRALSPRT